MSLALYIIVVILLINVVGWLAWRLVSRYKSIPFPSWLKWMLDMGNPFAKVMRPLVIIENADIKPGMKILDVGCGPGRLTIPAAKRVGSNGQVFAVDIQPQMLGMVEKKAKEVGLNNIQLVQAAMGTGKIDNYQVDRAILVTVLGEIPNRKPALKEIYNSLVPGGILSVTEIIFDPHFQRQNVVIELAEEVGFEKQAFFGKSWAYTHNLVKPLK